MTNAADFFYSGGGRREALEAIFEGVHRGDAVLLLVGAAGAGRTALIKRFRDEVDPHVLSVATCVGDILASADQLFAALAAELGESEGPPADRLWQAICRERDESRNVVLIVDDAHDLGAETRSAVVRFAREAGVALVLLGDETLAPDMDPEVAFEVIALRPLSEEESEAFVAGWLGIEQEDELPSHRTVARLHRHSAGLPGRLAGLLGAGAAERAPLLPHSIPVWHLALAGAALVLLTAFIVFMSSPTEMSTVPELPVEVAIPLPHPDTAVGARAAAERRVISAAVPQPLDAKPFVSPAAQQGDTAVQTATQADVTGEASAGPAASSEPEGLAPRVIGVPGARLSAAPASAPAKSAATAVRYSADETALLAEPRSRVALQLFASFNQHAVLQFQRRHPAVEIRIFRTAREDLPWFVAVTGSYRNREEARGALGRLPVELQALKPWARSLQGIQDELRRRKD